MEKGFVRISRVRTKNEQKRKVVGIAILLMELRAYLVIGRLEGA